jgi:hypothetical protein
MISYGNQVLSTNPSYRGWSYTPMKPRENYSKLNEKINDLSYEISSRRRYHQEAEIISNLSEIAQKINTPSKPPPASTNPSQNQDMSSMLALFQQEREMMMGVIQNLAKPAKTAKSYKKYKKSYKKVDSRDSSDSSSTFSRKKITPENAKKILAEMNFDDDGAEDYADKERKIKFDANLPEDEKYRIIMQMDKDKHRKGLENGVRFKGIKRFRIMAFVVYFPIVLVSNMLEKKSKFYANIYKNMETNFDVYLSVGQKWILKVMKTSLVSILNEPTLDLTLTNSELEIKNQTINTRIIKLQVRINGILEGLEEFTTIKEVPDPFKNFIFKITNNKGYIPPHFLTSFEKTRLEFDEFGGFMNMTEDKKKMIICFFFITRIMVKEVCLRPSEAGIPIKRGTKAME